MPPPPPAGRPCRPAIAGWTAWSRPWSRRRWRPADAWLMQGAAQRVQLGFQQRTGAGHRREAGDAVRGGLGAVRRAEGVVDVDVAQRGHLPGQRLVVLLLADVDAAVFQQHDLAGVDLDAVNPVLHQRHGHAQQLGQALADLASESASVSTPSFGRPRWDVTITAAPASSARRMPGTEARMRVSSEMRPASSNGTFRSARMNTRLPDRAPALASADRVCTLGICFAS